MDTSTSFDRLRETEVAIKCILCIQNVRMILLGVSTKILCPMISSKRMLTLHIRNSDRYFKYTPFVRVQIELSDYARATICRCLLTAI